MKWVKVFLRMLFFILGLGVMVSSDTARAESSSRLALFITGLSGNHATEINFEKAVQDLRAVLLLNGYRQEDFVRFADDKGLGQEKLWPVEKLATKANLSKYFQELAETGTNFETVFVFVSGHANGRDDEAMFHLPGDDMVYQELMAGIQNISARQMVIVAAASQGLAWIENLAGPGRIVVAGNGLREFDSMPALFLRTFPELWRKFPSLVKETAEGPAKVSLRDVFAESQRRVLHWYQNNGLQVTELAFLDADGDKKGESFLRPETVKKIFKDPGKTVVEASPDPDALGDTEEFPMDLTLPDAEKAGTLLFLTEKEEELES